MIPFIIAFMIYPIKVSKAPMKMSLADYMMDIRLAYLIIPTICVGFGYLLGRQRGQNAK